jgi:hypothetical protein
MKLVQGNLLDVTSGFIFHQVNCCRSMGAGLAKSICEKWPDVKTKYNEFCASKQPLDLLGRYQYVTISSELVIVNVFGQLSFGGRERHTDYGALLTAFDGISHDISLSADIYFPYLFGCGLAHGKWSIVREIIAKFFPHATIIQLA